MTQPDEKYVQMAREFMYEEEIKMAADDQYRHDLASLLARVAAEAEAAAYERCVKWIAPHMFSGWAK